MIQLIFFALFIITLAAGAFSYFSPAQAPLDPLRFIMENSGFKSVQVLNRKHMDQLNITSNEGLVRIRGQMEDIALVQNNLLNTIKEQQRILQNTGKEATDIMLEAQQRGTKDKDLLNFKTLVSGIQDQRQLLVARGQDLLVLNSQLMKNRQLIADETNLANINTEASLGTLRHNYSAIKDQSADFIDKVTQYNRQVSDGMNKMHGQLRDFASNVVFDNTEQQQNAKDHIRRMMDREHEDMIKLADSEERSKEILQDAQETLADSNELLKDKLEQNRDRIEEKRQNAQDQQWISQQRAADMKQQMQDRLDR